MMKILFLCNFFFFTLLHSQQAVATAGPNSSFTAALETLQTQIGYKFGTVDLLRRAVTHPSYSRENYRSLSLLGLDIVRSSSALRLLSRDVDLSPKDVDARVDSITGMSACAADALKLSLQMIVRVSQKTDPKADSIVCGAFRALFGAVAVDSGKVDVAGEVFWKVHGHRGANAVDVM